MCTYNARSTYVVLHRCSSSGSSSSSRYLKRSLAAAPFMLYVSHFTDAVAITFISLPYTWKNFSLVLQKSCYVFIRMLTLDRGFSALPHRLTGRRAENDFAKDWSMRGTTIA